MNLPKSITVCEVGLRDGLQNEKVMLSTAQKLAMLEKFRMPAFRSLKSAAW